MPKYPDPDKQDLKKKYDYLKLTIFIVFAIFALILFVIVMNIEAPDPTDTLECPEKHVLVVMNSKFVCLTGTFPTEIKQ